jgi:hypothetical protein
VRVRSSLPYSGHVVMVCALKNVLVCVCVCVCVCVPEYGKAY